MHNLGPKIIGPQDSKLWLLKAWLIIKKNNKFFLLFAVVVQVTILFFQQLLTYLGNMIDSNIIYCCSLPLVTTLIISCGIARKLDNNKNLNIKNINVTVIKVLSKSICFLLLLVMQIIIFINFINTQITLLIKLIEDCKFCILYNFVLVLSNTINLFLETQFGILGIILISCSLSFSVFVVPIQLFREFSLLSCWQYSILAMKLNSWLSVVLCLFSVLVVITIACIFGKYQLYIQSFSIQFAIYLGVLLYIAWKETFQDTCTKKVNNENLTMLNVLQF